MIGFSRSSTRDDVERGRRAGYAGWKGEQAILFSFVVWWENNTGKSGQLLPSAASTVPYAGLQTDLLSIS